MDFIAAQFAVEKFVARSKSPKRFHARNSRATASVAELKLEGGAPAIQFISEPRLQNHAPVFALRLRMRCRPRVRTRTRSRNRRQDSLRGGFLNLLIWALWQGCLPSG